MNPIVLLMIARMSLRLMADILSGNKEVALAAALLKIIQAAVTEYESHTGEPIDPDLIREINPLP